ncbi:M48 family zinc metallopeptidase [Phytophthora palmivora]|uniref:M48 family zinc metallopeptidase n=1 Tax=Phytophthora palmivora TaxID=4796 RepID=A0A2P4X453_9STRA|nr:M48 family zinc metallopeptidase [Phytophthora palmivora]
MVKLIDKRDLLTVRPQHNQKKKQSEPDSEQNTRQGSNLRTNTGHVVRLRRIRQCLSPNSSTVVPEGIKTVELETPNSCVTAGGDMDVYQAVDVRLTLHTVAGPVSIGTQEFGESEICANPKITTGLKRLVKVKELVQKAKVRNFQAEHLDVLERICTRFDLWRDELNNAPLFVSRQ